MRSFVGHSFVGSVCFTLALISASQASAAAITIPPGLAPGSTYFLCFVTSGTISATSDDIGVYDSFVTSQALLDSDLASLNTSWRAIGSTPTVDAVTHAAITGSVYRLDGASIAAGSDQMFGGGRRPLDSAIQVDQFGALGGARVVWTGSKMNGHGSPTAQLGASPIMGIGSSGAMSTDWIQANDIPMIAAAMYAISGPLQVPMTTVPEPGTLMLIAGSGLMLARRYRKKR